MDNRLKALSEVVLVYILLVMALRLFIAFPIGEWLTYLVLLSAIVILVLLAVKRKDHIGNDNASRDGGNYAPSVVKYSISMFFLILTGIWTAFILAWLTVMRRDISRYGITLRNLRGDIRVVAVCIIPMLAVFYLARFIYPPTPAGSLIFSAIEMLMLIVIAFLLTKIPYKEGKTIIDSRILIPVAAIGSIVLIFYMIEPSLKSIPGIAQMPLDAFIFAFALQAIPQEILFRGFMQSRLNEAFGRPYVFFGVNWGIGLIITSLLFGLIHVLNGFNPFTSDYQFYWTWGIFTAFAGLFYGYIREKTNDITAPTMLHGIWDAFPYFIH
jgi:hypothetical protein